MNRLSASGVDARIVAEAVTVPGPDDTVMYGVVSRPAVAPACRRAVVIAGRTAPGDFLRWFADSLAQTGLLVLRFDPVGTGDTPGGEADAEIPINDYHRRLQAGSFTESTKSAVTWLRRSYGAPEACVIALCGACASGLLAAAELPDAVSWLVMITPAVLYSTGDEEMRDYEASHWTRGYVRRLLNPSAYRNFLTGASDYKAIAKLGKSILRRAAALLRQAGARFSRRPRPNHPLFNWRFWEGFTRVMERRIPVLFLLAELDNETPDFNAEFKALVLDRHGPYSKLCTVQTLPKTDHSFNFEDGRRRARNAIVEWLRSFDEPADLDAAS